MFSSITPLLILLGIVLFWALMFVFAFWFANRALRAPQEGELAESHAGHADGLESAAVEADGRVASQAGH
jgi:hypothetical protein